MNVLKLQHIIDVMSTTKTQFLELVSTEMHSKKVQSRTVSHNGGIHANNLSCSISALLCQECFRDSVYLLRTI